MRPRDAHQHAMAEARRTHSLRTVQGHAYPVAEGQLVAWLSEQARKPQRITKGVARHVLRKVFQSRPE